jgi:hypothetical protein
MEEEKVDEELEKIKVLSRASSIDSQIGENPSQYINADNDLDEYDDSNVETTKNIKS